MTDLAKAKRIVVKIGTNTLCGASGLPDPWFMAAIADDVKALRDEGREVIVVSSGAIGAGRAVLGFKERPRDVKVRQACAAVGQSRLMQGWELAFARHGITVAQLLLTYHTFSNRASYLNLRNATETLLDLGVVPIVNENDTVSISEIDASFGDNDRLSALVASKVEADALVILSDVAGLYTRPPSEPGAALVPLVEGEITPEVRRMAGDKAGKQGRGGMGSKLDSAALAMDAGVTVVIARGREPRVLPRLLAGEAIGTRFAPRGREQGRKRWLAIAKPRGAIIVDAGAARALRAGKHLLPAGVTGVEGAFDVESVVDVRDEKGRAIARAVSSYASRDLERVKGMRSEEARAALALAEGSVNVTRKGYVTLLS